ncbi:MAG: hypothetical protein MMC23_003478 [Stictis urceolatum]|nr:hypothetical protein [Stictis urceolata]
MAEEKKLSPAYVRKQQYLIVYNLASAILWFSVLARVLIILPITGPAYVHDGVGTFARWVQTLAVLEIVHSALGLVRSPLSTTFLQVFSRILLVWGIVYPFPLQTSPSPFYSSMLIAWSVTEVVRYAFFVQNLRGTVPPALVWLRYNLFYVLYPVGISSECVMMWKASWATEGLPRFAIWAVLVGYVPGSYVLYTHMIKQRKKVMRSQNALDQHKRQRQPTMESFSKES